MDLPTPFRLMVSSAFARNHTRCPYDLRLAVGTVGLGAECGWSAQNVLLTVQLVRLKDRGGQFADWTFFEGAWAIEECEAGEADDAVCGLDAHLNKRRETTTQGPEVCKSGREQK